MKISKLCFSLIIILLIFCNLSLANSVTAKKVISAVAIDGQLEESFWEITNQLSINLGSSNNTATFGVLWDDVYLYIGVNVVDGRLCTNGRQGWYDDGVEIYIDGNNSQGTTFDEYDRRFVKPVRSYWIQEADNRFEGVVYQWIETTDGYSMEFAIPWDNLSISPSAAMNIGLDVVVNDDDNCDYAHNLPSQLLWSGNSNYYKNPSTWGTLVLSDQTVSYSGNYLALINPNGGDFCINNKTTVIKWVSNGLTNINIDYSTDDGNSWNSIATNLLTGSGSFSWDVFATPSDQCLIKISDAGNPSLNDTSESQFTISAALSTVEPLIPNSWDNFMWPYNAYYPDDPSGIHGHVGNACGHSSLARIIHYWEFPVVGNDQLTFTDNAGHTWSANFSATTYNYDNMPNYLPESSTEDEYKDVATLFYHAATSMHDIYGSGGNLDKMSYAMSHYFKYKESMPAERKNYTRAEWIQIIKNELDSGRVLLVCGMGLDVLGNWHENNNVGGHWYHVDGYNDDGDFHVVVGYGDEDDYYDADSMSGFAYNLGILTGLEPELNGKELSLQSHNGGEVLGNGEETDITWNSENIADIKIEYTTDNGNNWQEIIASTAAGAGLYTWTVPDITSDQCKVKLTDVTDINVYDKSNDVFSINVEPSPALQFDGTDDYAQVSNFIYPANDLTLEAWIKPDQFGSIREIIFGKNPDNSSGIQFRLNSDGSLLYGETPNWTSISTPASCIKLNEWNHVALAKESGLCKLYVNGEQLAEGTVNEGVNPTVISIGGRHTNMDRFYDGFMVDVRMWEVARTQDEIQANMNCSLNDSENGLIAYWRMNEGSGQTIFDLSGCGYDLQLGSTPDPDTNDPAWILTNWPYEVTLTLNFTALADMPSPKYGLGYTSSANYIYAVSGGLDDDGSKKMERYNISGGIWSEFASGLLPRCYCSSEFIASQNKIYLFNGYTYTGTSWTDTVEVVDITTGSHTVNTSNPYPVQYGGSAVWNDKIYVFGGKNGDGYSNRLYEFNPATDAWKRLADMPEAKQTNGEIVDGSLYVFGGYNGATSARIDAYNIAQNSWSHVGDMSTGVSTHAATVSAEYIWLVGDYSDLSFIAVYNTRTNEFKKLTSNMTPRRHAAAEVVGNKLYIYGGNNGVDVLNSLEVADISNYVTRMDKREADVRVENYTLEQNYPNPFNPATRINYDLPENTHVKITVFDVQGKMVNTLVDGYRTAGCHSVDFNGTDLSSGIYFYTIEAGTFSKTKKMILIR